jgi:large subunit ribosomal protein L9
VATSRKNKAKEEKSKILEQIKKITVVFKMTAGEKDKLFGSVTTKDIADELNKKGFAVEKKDVVIDDAIKVLGQHQAKINFGDGLEATIAVSVERAEA